jgi:hypothetical protein
MTPPITFTHKGWFGLCPVYIGDINTEGPCLDPRHWSLSWLMPVSEAIFGMAFWIMTTINPDYEPMWPIRITGKLAQPIVSKKGAD